MTFSRGYPILLVGAARDDPQRLIRLRPLQCLHGTSLGVPECPVGMSKDPDSKDPTSVSEMAPRPRQQLLR
jgi:hypothetical protein